MVLGSERTDSTTRLKNWLDPDSTGVMYLDGVALGIPALTRNLSIQIFPNPFTDEIQVKIEGMKGQTAKIEVLNLMGTTLWSGTIASVGSSPISLSLPELLSGIYFLRITTPGSVSIIKMIRK